MRSLVGSSGVTTWGRSRGDGSRTASGTAIPGGPRVMVPARQVLGVGTAGDLVDVIREVARRRDLIHGLGELASRAAQVPGVRIAAVLVTDEFGVPQVVGLSDHALTPTSLVARLRTEATVSAACSGDVPAVDLDPASGSWAPEVLAGLAEVSCIGVAVVPPVTPSTVAGTLLAILDAEWLDGGVTALAVFADLIAVVVQQAGSHPDEVARVRTLRRALDDRNTIEQAKGMLAERFAVPPDVAWVRLRSRADALGVSIAEVAAAVVNRSEESGSTRSLGDSVDQP